MREANIDRIGAIASGICAVHCVLTGVAIGLMSFSGLQILGSSITDGVFLVTALAIAAVALVHGICKHHSFKPAIVFGIGIASMTIGHFAFKHEHTAGTLNIVGTGFAVGGGLCLVAFHCLNLRLAAKCRCNHGKLAK